MQTPPDEVGAERKPDRHFEKLNDQFCSGHFAIVVVPLSGDVRSPRLLSHCRLPHSITSSARPTSGSGTVMPSALAVLRLMISSIFGNLVYGFIDSILRDQNVVRSTP